MTKRAGRRKYRNGTQRCPPGKVSETEAISEIGSPQDLLLELRALRDGWLEEDSKKLNLVVKKMLLIALREETDPTVAIRAFRAVEGAVYRQRRLALGSLSIEMRNDAGLPPQLPPALQVNIQNNVQSPAAIAQSSDVTVAELVTEMLSRSDVQEALDAEVPGKGQEYGA